MLLRKCQTHQMSNERMAECLLLCYPASERRARHEVTATNKRQNVCVEINDGNKSKQRIGKCNAKINKATTMKVVEGDK